MSRLIPSAMIFVATSFLLACGNSGSSRQPAVADVYAAGYISKGPGAGVGPAYWKNGVLSVLSGSGNGQALAIVVSGTDIYVAGNDSNSGPVYWKNGQLTALSPGCSLCSASASGIFVSGSDVYVAGYQLRLPPQGDAVAVYWKNGTLIPLTDGTQGAEAQSIFVSGGDVYVGGWEMKTVPIGSNSNFVGQFSKYWKNGTPVDLDNGMFGGTAFSIFVSGSDVYGAGTGCDDLQGGCSASLWKNGSRTELSNQGNTRASSIVVSGGDVYACGTLFSNPDVYSNTAVYWKNDVMVALTSGESQGFANQIAISGSDVYIGGADSDSQGTFAQYWKNGTPVRLTGPQPASVSSITVVAN